jgi:hypothetical protein
MEGLNSAGLGAGIMDFSLGSSDAKSFRMYAERHELINPQSVIDKIMGRPIASRRSSFEHNLHVGADLYLNTKPISNTRFRDMKDVARNILFAMNT